MEHQPSRCNNEDENGATTDEALSHVNDTRGGIMEPSPLSYKEEINRKQERTGSNYTSNIVAGSQGFRQERDNMSVNSIHNKTNGRNSISRTPGVSLVEPKGKTHSPREFNHPLDKDSQISEKLLPQSEVSGQRKKSDVTVEIEMDTFLPKPDPDEDENWSDSDDEDDELNGNAASRCIIIIRRTILRGFTAILIVTRGYLIHLVLMMAYLAYFFAAMFYRFGDEGSLRLLGCTLIGLIIVTRGVINQGYHWLLRKVTEKDELSGRCKERIKTIRFFVRWLLYGVVAGLVVWVLIDTGIKEPTNLRAVPGFIIFLLLCFFFSSHPGKINYHTIFWSIGLQFIFALFVLRLDFGKKSIFWLQSRVDEFFKNSIVGSKLLFGEDYEEHYVIFGALPLIFFSNGMMSLLYYLGAMQFVIRVVGNFLTFALETSPIESMCVTAGTFLEGATSLTAFRPYLRSLSKSQLFLVMASSFSSIGGAYLAVLTRIGVSAEFLIGAMLVSAPATFTVCKLMVPETKVNKNSNDKITNIGNQEKGKYVNALDAVQTGAMAMLPVVGNVAVSAFTLVCFIEWVNHTLNWFGDRVGVEGLTIELIASYVLYLLPMAMGVPSEDCRRGAMLYGYRLFSSNIVSFLKLTEMKRNRMMYENYTATTNGTVSLRNDDIILDQWNQTLKLGFITERSEAILTYSLCGFSSTLSVAIHLSVMATFAPNRMIWLSKVAIVALLAGNVTNCMTGCLACLFYTES